MRKYYLYAAVLCSAAVLGLGGCSNKADAATTLPLVSESKPVVSESQEPTSSPEETTVVETVSGTIEGTEEQPEQTNHNEKILALYSQGKSYVEIAKELGLGQGEVRLVVGLYKGVDTSEV